MNEREQAAQAIAKVKALKDVADELWGIGDREHSQAWNIVNNAIDVILNESGNESAIAWFVYENDSGKEGLPFPTNSEEHEVINNVEEFLDYVYRSK